MKFGPVAVDDARGAILAHSVALSGGRLRKGELLTDEHLSDLVADGIDTVIVARPDPNDVLENEAAARIAAALAPEPDRLNLRISNAFTGRVNLIAKGPGVVVLDEGRLHTLNRIDPMITLATVPQFQQMAEGGMVGTIKIISYAVDGDAVAQAEALVTGEPPLKLVAPVMKTARLIVTEIPRGAGDKGVKAIDARAQALSMELSDVVKVPHQLAAITEALRAPTTTDLTLILTGSATSDPYDIAPQALRDAGGQVERFGMPVDPGNLLFLGDLKGHPVIGLPGCARSPALNGADWVLSRVACGLTVTSDDIAGMGIGGLLKEIPTRPQPRAGR